MRQFADTSYYLALLNVGDEYHLRARGLSGRSGKRHVTTAWVLTELADALSHPSTRLMVGQFIKDLYRNPRMTIVPPSQELLDQGLERFMARRDKLWSLTDCISFVVMEQLGLRDALSADHHFEQAGFTILLR
ncbi:MAG: type II toxin-antitoxin system VapC family toxin [Planctomycetes bacterium]|nr:type II toxin-antitoxin system VapC family toxin [Planctomycetota bacterium]